MPSIDPFSPVSASRPARARLAFTLIELLTVIAIIGILASILIPTVAKVRSSARKSQCVSNLRQLHTAVSLFTNDNKGVLPLTLDRKTNKNWWEAGSSFIVYASNALTTQRLSVCPSNETAQPIPSTDSYGKWVKCEYGYPYAANYLVMPDALVGIGLNKISSPSLVVLMTDSARDADWGPGLYLTPSVTDHVSRIGLQHGSAANTLWLDGHVSFSDKDSIKTHCVIQ